ncbi:MAG: EamA family transporter, partial [Pseudomonadota bacterium]
MRKDLLPSAGIALGASMWGLFWIPVRGIEAAGVESFWTGPVIFGAGSVLFLPFMLLRSRSLISGWREFLLPGLLSGLAFSLYTASLLITEVVRAMLLFYISPLWSILLGVLILNEKFTVNRMLAVILALGGLYVMLVVEGGFPIPRNMGDWFALASGICWSLASVRLFQGGVEQLVEKVTTFIMCAFFTSLMLVFWQQGSLSGIPGMPVLV